MENKLLECIAALEEFGETRDFSDPPRSYFQSTQRNLQSLSQVALDGREDRSDFADFFDGSPVRMLRTTINKYSSKFASNMRVER